MAKEFTREELQQYNGQNSQPAYVAVEGTIYDVSEKAAWTDGQHHGNFAGKDLTKIINEVSPHGQRVLKGLPVVGTLVD